MFKGCPHSWTAEVTLIRHLADYRQQSAQTRRRNQPKFITQSGGYLPNTPWMWI